MGILSAFGLMKKADFDEYVTETAGIARRNAELAKENGLLVSQRDMLTTKFNQSVKDIAAQADEIANLKSTFNQRLADAVQDYQADAEAMRAKRKRDRDLKAEKAKAAAAPKAASKKAAR